MGRIMRPFNLDEYLKNPKLKVTTRDGKDVRIICTNVKGTHFPVVALWDFDGKKEMCEWYRVDGRSIDEFEQDCDLVFATEKKVGWINIFKNYDAQCYKTCVDVFKTKVEALNNINSKNGVYLTTIQINWEE